MSGTPALAAPAARVRTIVVLALPIIGGMVSQNVLNLVDAWFVGSLGDAAIAAVGMGGFANFLATAFITGLSAGVQATAARRLGEGRHDETATSLNAGLALAIGIAVPWSALLIVLAPLYYPLLNGDPAVQAEGVPYLQARLVGAAALGANFAFRGYWSGINRSGNYLRTLLFMHVCNVFLNWVLIFGNLGAPALGALGSGVATTIATYLGTAYYVWLGWRDARRAGFLRARPTPAMLRDQLRLAAPAGTQQTFFAAGYVALFLIIGRIGTSELAAANQLVNLMLTALLPGMGIGIAGASLVGQALGRGDVDDARRWGWDVVKVAMLAMGVLGLPMVLAPDALLTPFLPDPETRALAVAPMRWMGALMAVDAIGIALLNTLLGAGDTRTVARVGVGLQWGLFLPLAWWFGPVLGGSLMTVWGLQIGYRALQSLVLATVWARGGWARVRV